MPEPVGAPIMLVSGGRGEEGGGREGGGREAGQLVAARVTFIEVSRISRLEY